MKNLFNLTALFAMLFFFVSCEKDTIEKNTFNLNQNEVESDIYAKKEIRVDLTLSISDNCTVHIVGTIDVNIWKMEIQGYDLTVTFSGGGCDGTFNVTASIDDTSTIVRGNSKLTEEFDVYETQLYTSGSIYQEVIDSEEFLSVFESEMSEFVKNNY